MTCRRPIVQDLVDESSAGPNFCETGGSIFLTGLTSCQASLTPTGTYRRMLGLSRNARAVPVLPGYGQSVSASLVDSQTFVAVIRWQSPSADNRPPGPQSGAATMRKSRFNCNTAHNAAVRFPATSSVPPAEAIRADRWSTSKLPSKSHSSIPTAGSAR